MNVLVTGGYGFIGTRCVEALAAAGHHVVRAGRTRSAASAAACPCTPHMAIDFLRDFDSAVWERRLDGIDVVVNAVGAMNEGTGQAFDAVHVRAPCALFDACAARGVRVLQLSALGADDQAASRFHVTKREADCHLLATHADACVLQPSLVYGEGGASARLFAMLASLPVVPLPGRGRQLVQPVHVDDVAAAVVALVDGVPAANRILALVGPAPLSLAALLAELRRALGLGRARFLPVPMPFVRAAVACAARLRVPWADPDALGMLERGSTADPGSLRTLLGRPARPVGAFVRAERRDAARTRATLDWMEPVLRLALACVWIAGGIVPLALSPLGENAALVEALGAPHALAVAAVYAGAAVDIALGAATLAPRRPRRLWTLQAAVVVVYTAIISVGLPEQWLHPFGPVVKNLPILALIWLLHELDRHRWTT